MYIIYHFYRLKFFSTDFGHHEPDPYCDFDHIIVFFDWCPKLKFLMKYNVI